MTNNPFSEGDRVILIDPYHKYGDSALNPRWDGEQPCVGTVLQSGSIVMTTGVKVHLDNDIKNIYPPDDLHLHDEPLNTNPNKAYRIEKLKMRKSAKEKVLSKRAVENFVKITGPRGAFGG